MQIRITLLIVSFIYTMLTSIVYFSKNRINNSENAVYEKLLSITPIGLLLEIGCNVTAIYKMNDLVSSIISRLYLIFILVWLTTFTLYILTITKYKGDKLTEYKNSKIRKSIIIGSIFSILLLIFLPIDFVLEKNSAYLGGMGIVFLLAITFLLIILDFILFIKYFKNMTFREKVPMLLLLLLIGGLLLVNNIAPEIQIISSSFALITVIMYFTIENPDKKLLEEIHMSKKIADAANEDKSMLIYNMMNEVKSIASDINKSSEVILNSNNLEENRFFAREIISSNNKLYSMANNIYNIDVIDDINVKTVKNKYNIKLLLKGVISKNKELFEDKDISFRFNIDSNLPNTLYGDSINLKNVLNTIIGNSYKYTDKGYVELSVNAIFKKDVVRLIIKIEDSGIGIKAEDLDKCLNKNTKDQNSLYGARKTINIMGGNLLISSEYNKGTIVTIILDQKIYTNNNKDNYDNYVNNKKILIIDDNNSSIKLISKILDKHNILYDSSNLGKEALDRIRKGDKYDLILLDEDMPYMNGISVMNKFSKIKGFGTKVILLTKNSNIIYDDIYKDSGFSDYIIKPIDKDDLMNKINKYLK
ncbi:MAG TPA: response regulator [Bacilli bacterium]|mgnify:CR=1 FL=1|nr:response regulator [Bacilli bacterium]